MTNTAIYTRISRDTEGTGLGVERQLQDCRALADRLGWEVVAEFSDNDISAAGTAKARPEYDEMIRRVEAGEIEGILAYSASRITRRVREYLDLIDLYKTHGVLIKTVASGEPDLATADGRAVALTLATWDAAEAERTSERLKRQKADRAARGLIQGGRYRNYGYSRSFELIEEEAEIVREMFARRVEGQSMTSIAKDLASRGVVTSSGKLWSAASLGKALSRPIYCGLRSHNGEIIGKTADSIPAIITEAEWRAAQQVTAQGPVGTNARRWMLSGLARCGRCGYAMTGTSTKQAYRCQSAHGGCGLISVKTRWLDGPIASLILARASAQAAVARPSTPQVDHGQALATIDAEIQEAHALRKAGDLGLMDFSQVVKELRAKRRDAEQRAVTQETAQVGALVTQKGWSEMDLSARRALIGRHLDTVTVGPRQSKGPGRFEPERYEIRWLDGSTQMVTQADLDSISTWSPDDESWIHPANTVLLAHPDAPEAVSEVTPEPGAKGLVGPITLRI